ncbi:ABC transporter permease subunit [Haloimpatiens lingqiaonensis]|uniref:ABC transporter permease subunit n=1 Tax=Haloimpatiens lingqiaonensis TaxID=1380675 RepID=UPI0010FEB3AE|nr:ABC transporter permease subunit [Haloimpatiens lingqiaonensis]
MNLYIREMKAHRKALIIWCIGMVFMVGAGMAKYGGLSSTGQDMSGIIAKMPKALQSVVGAGLFDLSKASGFYGVLFLYLVIMSTIHAAILGATIISKEEMDKTSEFLFVKPISRNKIITCKILAALSNILILNIVTLISSLIIVGNYGKGEAVANDIGVLMIGMFILQLMFMFLGTGMAAISNRAKNAAQLTTGILMTTYILSMAIDMNENLEKLKYITPYKYYDAKNLMYGRGFETVYLVLSFMIIMLLVILTYVFYEKRDLNV